MPVGRERHRFRSSIETAPAERSSERKRVRLNARIQESNLERVVGQLTGLPNELIQPLPGHNPVAVRVHVGSVRLTRAPRHRSSRESGSVSRRGAPSTRCRSRAWKAVHDGAAGLLERGLFRTNRPDAGERPLVQSQLTSFIGLRHVVFRRHPARRSDRSVRSRCRFRGIERRPARKPPPRLTSSPSLRRSGPLPVRPSASSS